MNFYQFQTVSFPANLDKEILDVQLPLKHIETIGLDAKILFTRELSPAELEQVAAIVNNNITTAITLKKIKDAVCAAVSFGQSLFIDYGVKNVLRGYTESQIQQVSSELEHVQHFLLGGALRTAKTAIAELGEGGIVSSEDKAEFIAKIDAYLETE